MRVESEIVAAAASASGPGPFLDDHLGKREAKRYLAELGRIADEAERREDRVCWS